jgi:uncharacterized membrane protein YfhO
VTIDASLNCRGMVILTDTWAPGWTASVDGEPARIEQAYGIVRGVVVDRGNHTIEMWYRPWSVVAGGAMTLLGVALCVLCVGQRHALPFRRQRMAPPHIG